MKQALSLCLKEENATEMWISVRPRMSQSYEAMHSASKEPLFRMDRALIKPSSGLNETLPHRSNNIIDNSSADWSGQDILCEIIPSFKQGDQDLRSTQQVTNCSPL